MININEVTMGCLIDTPEGVRATRGAQLDIGALDFDNGSRYDIRLCHPIPITEEWINKLDLTVYAKTGDETAITIQVHDRQKRKVN